MIARRPRSAFTAPIDSVHLTVFAFQCRCLGPLVGPSEESPTAVAADPAVVRVMDFAGWSFIAADRTNPVVVNFRNVGVDKKVDGPGHHFQNFDLKKM